VETYPSGVFLPSKLVVLIPQPTLIAGIKPELIGCQYPERPKALMDWSMFCK
jgi:hypothetical protein